MVGTSLRAGAETSHWRKFETCAYTVGSLQLPFPSEPIYVALQGRNTPAQASGLGLACKQTRSPVRAQQIGHVRASNCCALTGLAY